MAWESLGSKGNRSNNRQFVFREDTLEHSNYLGPRKQELSLILLALSGCSFLEHPEGDQVNRRGLLHFNEMRPHSRLAKLVDWIRRPNLLHGSGWTLSRLQKD